MHRGRQLSVEVIRHATWLALCHYAIWGRWQKIGWQTSGVAVESLHGHTAKPGARENMPTAVEEGPAGVPCMAEAPRTRQHLVNKSIAGPDCRHFHSLFV